MIPKSIAEKIEMAAKDYPREYEIKHMNADTPPMSGEHYLTWGYKKGANFGVELVLEEAEKLVSAMKDELKAMGDCCCGAEEQVGEGYGGITCYLHEALQRWSEFTGDGE